MSVIYPEFFGAPCRKNYALDRKMIHTYYNGFEVLYHQAKFGEIKQRMPAIVLCSGRLILFYEAVIHLWILCSIIVCFLCCPFIINNKNDGHFSSVSCW